MLRTKKTTKTHSSASRLVVSRITSPSSSVPKSFLNADFGNWNSSEAMLNALFTASMLMQTSLKTQIQFHQWEFCWVWEKASPLLSSKLQVTWLRTSRLPSASRNDECTLVSRRRLLAARKLRLRQACQNQEQAQQLQAANGPRQPEREQNTMKNVTHVIKFRTKKKAPLLPFLLEA